MEKEPITTQGLEKLKKELSKNKTKVFLIKGDLGKEQDLKKIIKFSKNKLKYKN